MVFAALVFILNFITQYSMQHLFFQISWAEKFSIFRLQSQRGTLDSVTGFSVLSNSADIQNVSCLGIFVWNICSKSYPYYRHF